MQMMIVVDAAIHGDVEMGRSFAAQLGWKPELQQEVNPKIGYFQLVVPEYIADHIAEFGWIEFSTPKFRIEITWP